MNDPLREWLERLHRFFWFMWERVLLPVLLGSEGRTLGASGLPLLPPYLSLLLDALAYLAWVASAPLLLRAWDAWGARAHAQSWAWYLAALACCVVSVLVHLCAPYLDISAGVWPPRFPALTATLGRAVSPLGLLGVAFLVFAAAALVSLAVLPPLGRALAWAYRSWPEGPEYLEGCSPCQRAHQAVRALWAVLRGAVRALARATRTLVNWIKR